MSHLRQQSTNIGKGTRFNMCVNFDGTTMIRLKIYIYVYIKRDWETERQTHPDSRVRNKDQEIQRVWNKYQRLIHPVPSSVHNHYHIFYQRAHTDTDRNTLVCGDIKPCVLSYFNTDGSLGCELRRQPLAAKQGLWVCAQPMRDAVTL